MPVRGSLSNVTIAPRDVTPRVLEFLRRLCLSTLCSLLPTAVSFITFSDFNPEISLAFLFDEVYR